MVSWEWKDWREEMTCERNWNDMKEEWESKGNALVDPKKGKNIKKGK